MTYLVAALALAAALSATAQASTISTSDGSDPSSYVAALATGYMPTPPGEVVVNPTGCPGGAFGSCSFAWAPRTLYLAPHNPAVEPFTGMFDHELGHAVDGILAEANTDHRTAFLQFRGLAAGTPWETPLREQFADLYGTCAQRGLTAPDAADVTTLSYGFTFTAAQYAAGCGLLFALTSAAGFDHAGAVWTPPTATVAVAYKPRGLSATYRCYRRGAWRTYTRRPRHCHRLVVVPVKGRRR